MTSTSSTSSATRTVRSVTESRVPRGLSVGVRFLSLSLALLLGVGCAAYRGPYTTQRDNTAWGAGIGAGVGAVAAVLDGKEEADEILAGAAIGAALGAGVGAYMDAQEEKLARIPGTTVERVGPKTLLVHFQSDVLFDVDSAALGGGARGSLSQAAAVMNEFRKTAIVVQGHTDSTGSENHNQGLSERRARSVEGYLIHQGVDPGRITSIGDGEGMPIASNGNESGRRLNRRVDIMLRAKAR
ncbi:MAG: OmpA family protein [Thermoanaerobaculia bacterium]|nr:OmpA family protein [Thermoanaerobaculia bacterium]